MANIDSSASTVATNALSAIPYASLIGGPLDACIKAQATSAMTTVDFIRAVGFQKGPTGENEVVNVTFQYTKDGERMDLVVPLLAIVPVPYIGIDEITIDFKANISAESSSVSEQAESTATTGELSGGASLGIGPFSIKVNFKANYSSKKDSKATQQSKYSVEYTMDIHVAASQSDMPAGLAKVLNILEANISAAPAGGAVVLTKPSVAAKKGDTVSVEITVLDAKDKPKGNVQVTVSGLDAPPPAATTAADTGKAKIDLTVPTTFEPGVHLITFAATPETREKRATLSLQVKAA